MAVCMDMSRRKRRLTGQLLNQQDASFLKENMGDPEEDRRVLQPSKGHSHTRFATSRDFAGEVSQSVVNSFFNGVESPAKTDGSEDSLPGRRGTLTVAMGASQAKKRWGKVHAGVKVSALMKRAKTQKEGARAAKAGCRLCEHIFFC